MKAKLEKEILSFSDWLASEGLGKIQPNQCEVTYTNLIDLTELEHLHADLSRITPLLNDTITENMSAELEDTTTSSRFIFFTTGSGRAEFMSSSNRRFGNLILCL